MSYMICMGTWRRDSQRELVGGICNFAFGLLACTNRHSARLWCPRDIPWQAPCASATQSQAPTASPSPGPNLYGINPTQDGQTMVGPLTMLAQVAGMQVPDSPQQDENEASETDSFLRDLELELFRRERGSLN
jgi:hypothetical protein